LNTEKIKIKNKWVLPAEPIEKRIPETHLLKMKKKDWTVRKEETLPTNMEC
jgi:hypothetical protein